MERTYPFYGEQKYKICFNKTLVENQTMIIPTKPSKKSMGTTNHLARHQIINLCSTYYFYGKHENDFLIICWVFGLLPSSSGVALFIVTFSYFNW